MPRNWNPNALPDIVPKVYSIDAVLRGLNIPLSGGNRTTVKRWIDKLSIDTSHFTGQAHRRGSDQPMVEAIPLEEILVENSTYTNTHRLKLRLISSGIKEHVCESCGITHWLGNKTPLELHHKNGTRDDHRISNINLLCPNCHAVTDNYRAKNI